MKEIGLVALYGLLDSRRAPTGHLEQSSRTPARAAEPAMQSLGCGASAVEPRLRSPGCGASAAEPWLRSPGCGAPAAEPRLRSLGCGASAAEPRLRSLGCGAPAEVPRRQSPRERQSRAAIPGSNPFPLHFAVQSGLQGVKAKVFFPQFLLHLG